METTTFMSQLLPNGSAGAFRPRGARGAKRCADAAPARAFVI